MYEFTDSLYLTLMLIFSTEFLNYIFQFQSSVRVFLMICLLNYLFCSHTDFLIPLGFFFFFNLC